MVMVMASPSEARQGQARPQAIGGKSGEAKQGKSGEREDTYRPTWLRGTWTPGVAESGVIAEDGGDY